MGLNRGPVGAAYLAFRRSVNALRAKGSDWDVPVEATAAELDAIRLAKKFTMTSPDALWAALQASKYVVEGGVPGAIVECGVWRGGA